MSKPRQPACPKFVAPLDEMTPSPLAGPGVSRPTARTAVIGSPVNASTCCTQSTSDWMALSGPSLTLLGTSAISSMRNRPSESRIVPLLAVPPLSTPTTIQSTGMRPPLPAAEPPQVYGNALAESNIATDLTRQLPPPPPATSHIGSVGGMSQGTDEGAMTIRSPSPTIASATGTSTAAFAGSSFWARTRTVITPIQATLMMLTATSTSISPMDEPAQQSPNPNPDPAPSRQRRRKCRLTGVSS